MRPSKSVNKGNLVKTRFEPHTDKTKGNILMSHYRQSSATGPQWEKLVSHYLWLRQEGWVYPQKIKQFTVTQAALQVSSSKC